MLLVSGTLLFYTAMVVPVQIFMWDYSNQCNMFPTLYFDVMVDLFFLVSFLSRMIASITPISVINDIADYAAPDTKSFYCCRWK